MAKKKKKNKYTISAEEIRNMEKAEERKQRLENGTYWPSNTHHTSKKDQFDRESNNIKDYDP